MQWQKLKYSHVKASLNWQVSVCADVTNFTTICPVRIGRHQAKITSTIQWHVVTKNLQQDAQQEDEIFNIFQPGGKIEILQKNKENKSIQCRLVT
jgi:hypothetical protein